MSNSPLLGLPYLAASQAQKHVTHNEALSMLDGLLHLSMVTRGAATPPGSPNDGDRYLIAASPTGAWLGHAGHIALRMEGAWRFSVPRKGWSIWIEDEALTAIFNGTTWVSSALPSSLQNMAMVGVNATADTTNKLAVNSSAVLFNNVGAGVQLKINKAAAGDTASLLLQTGFSGRAEIGTAGDDDLHVKVSADGSSFNEALVVSAGTGLVTVKNNMKLDPQATDPATMSDGQLWYNSTTGKFRARQNGANVDIVSSGSGLTDGDKGDISVSGSGSVWAIDNAVITNAKLADIPTATIKGRATAGAGVTEDLTATQATALLDVFASGSKGLVPASGGGTTTYLRADGTFATLAAGDVVGPASATDNALVRFNSTTGKLIENSTVTVSDAGQINAIAGTTTDAPIKITAGTLNTTAQAGAIEFDGTNLYGTVDAGNRGYIPVVNFIRQDAEYTLTSSTAEQKLFNSSANGRLTLEVGTYLFEGMVGLRSMSATSGNAAFDLQGTGTAVLGSIWMYIVGSDANTTVVGTQSGVFTNSAQSPASAVTVATAADMNYSVKGTFEVTTAGTIQPSVTLVTAAAAIVRVGSYFKTERMGSTSVAALGQWD